MRKGISIMLGWMVTLGLFLGVAWAQDGSVKITSPKNHEVIKGASFTVKFEFEKRGRGDHIHVFVDGKLYDVIKEGNATCEVEDLGSGVHSIMLQVFTSEHQPLAPYDLIRIKVE